MTEYALPCVVCGTTLRNVSEGVENQPDGGVAFSSPGHYGSSVFDPMDGCFIELNLCDPCLVEAGEKGRVLLGRRQRPVSFEGFEVGYEELNTPLVQWHRGLPGYSDTCELVEEDLKESLPSSINVNEDALEAARRLMAHGGE